MKTRLPRVEANDFMCRCSGKRKARCDRVLAAARKLVSTYGEPKNDIDFVDRLLYRLTLDGDLSIAADQWAGVFVKPLSDDPEIVKHYDVKESVRIQCDSIVDGLAAAVVFYEQQKRADGR